MALCALLREIPALRFASLHCGGEDTTARLLSDSGSFHKTVELYARDGFVYLQRGKLQIMLEHAGGHWATDALERPFGRGINIQMEVPDAAAMTEWLIEVGIILYRPLQLSWYRARDIEHGQQEFLVQDPDGYLLRFVTPFGKRAAQ